MSRSARIVYPEMPHHIVHRGNRRESVFFKDSDRKYYLALLKEACRRYNVEIWSWCLMNNHVHLLLSPKDLIGLAKVMQQVARNYSIKINRRQGWTGRLWEVRYYSCIIDQKAYLWAASGYIEMNPVRAGLVAKAEEWEWSSAQAHLLGRSDRYFTLKQWLEENEKQQYRAFISEQLREEEIFGVRRATSTGRPLGTDDFITNLENRLGKVLHLRKRGRKTKIK